MVYISESENSFGKNQRKKMRLMIKKRFKDDESGTYDGHTESYKRDDDTDMKILESDYSSSTFHLASRSSMVGNGKAYG